MNVTQWQRVQSLVSQALEFDGTERSSFLTGMCRENNDLRRQVDELIESYEQVGNLLEDVVGACAEAASGESAPLTGQRIGPYQLSSVVGIGGMGTVYDAQRVDDQFHQQVAIKVMHAGLGMASEALLRFRAERQILANLIHPNIARLLDGGITKDNMPYLVMEYIEGTTIDRYAAANELSIESRLELFRQICAAIQYAHQNLVVHRDIKPANVMVTREGAPKLLDFGIAKLLDPNAIGQTAAWTRPTERLMTPEYASPEQIRGETITTATDVYGLGALLYELLTGRRPFETKNLSPAAIEHLICERAPERPSTAQTRNAEARDPGGRAERPQEAVSHDLDNIVLKAMHKDPQRRYSSAFELSEDIRRYLEGFPVLARTDSWSYRSRKFVQRHRWGTAAAALFLLTTTGLSIGLAIQARRASVQAVRARREAETSKQVAQFLTSLFQSTGPDKTQGRSTSARELLDRGADRIPQDLASQPVVQANLLQILGSTYYSFGDLDKAQSLLEQAYSLDARQGSAQNDDGGAALQQLAIIESDKGNHRKAIEEDEQVLSLFEKLHGARSDEVAGVVGDLGYIYWQATDPKHSEPLLRQSMETYTSLHGPDDPRALLQKSNLSTTLVQAGDYAGAAQLSREVLQSRMRVLGPNDPDIAVNLDNLAAMMLRLGQYRGAETYARQGLELRRKIFGPSHPEICRSLQVLGGLERRQGRYDEAARDEQQALDMARKLLGPRSVWVIYIEDELGMAQLGQHNLKAARATLSDSLGMVLADPTSSKPQIATEFDHLAQLELVDRHFSQSQKDLDRALEIRSQLVGIKRDPYVQSLAHQGELFLAEAKYKDAEAKFREAAQIEQSIFPGAHPMTAEALYGLGQALEGEGQTAQARKALEDALAMRRQVLPAGSPDVVQAEEAVRKLDEKNIGKNSAASEGQRPTAPIRS